MASIPLNIYTRNTLGKSKKQNLIIHSGQCGRHGLYFSILQKDSFKKRGEAD